MADDTDDLIRDLRARLTGDWQRDAVMLQTEAEKRLDQRAALRAIGELMQSVLPGQPRRQLIRALCQDRDYCEAVLDGAAQAIAGGDPVQALRDLEPLQEAEEVYLNTPSRLYLGFDNPVQLSYFRTRVGAETTVQIAPFPFSRYYRVYVQALTGSGTLPSCLGVCDRALVRNPLFAEILLVRAQVCRRLSDTEGARSALVRALPLLHRASELAMYFREAAELLAAERDWEAAHAAIHASNQWQPTDAAATIAARVAQASGDAPAPAPDAATWTRILRDRDLPWEHNLAWCSVAAQVAESAMADADYSTAGLAWTIQHELAGDAALAERIAECRRQGGVWD